MQGTKGQSKILEEIFVDFDKYFRHVDVFPSFLRVFSRMFIISLAFLLYFPYIVEYSRFRV